MGDRGIQSKNITKKVLLTGALVAAVVAAPSIAFAVSDTADTTINAKIASVISVSTSSTVNLNITPVNNGAQTTAKDQVKVSTNNTSGYNLTLADSDATTTLAKGTDTIAASSSTQTSPAVLSNNTWGYHVDSLAGFGTGAAAVSNAASSTVKFAGVPASGSATTINTTATTATNDITNVWYSAKADTTKPNGTYTDTVTYTATTN